MRDSLGPQLPGWLARMGAEVLAGDLVADDLEAVAETLAQAARESDLVITTGGTAAGPRDHLRAAIERNSGTILVDCVAVRPGHPMLLAELGIDDGRRVPLVGLPGNPVSVVVAFELFVRPALRAVAGIEPVVPAMVTGPAGEPIDHPGGPATHFVRVRRTDRGWVSTGGGGSHLIAGIAAADALAMLEPGASIAPGEQLVLMPLWT